MFSVSIMIQKALKGVATALCGVLSTVLAKHLGVDLTPEQQAGMIAAVVGLLVGLTNYLKKKFPKQFGWL